MKIIISRVVLGSHEIPTRVRKLIRDEGLQYDAQTLEELRQQHAQALLRGVNDSAANALSYALGMKDLDKAALQKLADGSETKPEPKAKSGGPYSWDLVKNDPAFNGGDTLYGGDGSDDQIPVIVNTRDGQHSEWQFGFMDADDGTFTGDPAKHEDYHVTTVGDRQAIIDHFKKHGIEPPTATDFESIE